MTTSRLSATQAVLKPLDRGTIMSLILASSSLSLHMGSLYPYGRSLSELWTISSLHVCRLG